ncbi:MAG: hypothetical protein J6Z23_03540, partial [Lachnospiraceae bacterium]|nr:hypothetical protein [Lachnospiraceae bacterium]
MAAGTDGAELRLEPNSRPYLLKRILSDGTDIAAVFLLFLLFTAVVMMTPLADGYNAHAGRYQEIVRETADALGDP